MDFRREEIAVLDESVKLVDGRFLGLENFSLRFVLDTLEDRHETLEEVLDETDLLGREEVLRVLKLYFFLERLVHVLQVLQQQLQHFLERKTELNLVFDFRLALLLHILNVLENVLEVLGLFWFLGLLL